MKMLSRPDGSMWFGKLSDDFFSTSELLDPNIKSRLRLIKATPYFYMISDKPNVSLEIVDCSLNTRHFALKDTYNEKRLVIIAYTPVDFNFLKILAKIFIFSSGQNQIIQENILNNAPVRRIAIATNTKSAFTGSHTGYPFWYQQFDLRQYIIPRGGQTVVDFAAAHYCRLYVTTMKAMNNQCDISSFPIDNFKDHCVLVFDELQCKMLLKIFIIQYLLENHWGWS